jgi:hypothetical protein
VAQAFERALSRPAAIGASFHGDYLLGKVSKVFPQLRRDVLDQKEKP